MNLAVEAEPGLPGHVLMEQGDGAGAAEEALQPDVPEDQQHQVLAGGEEFPEHEFLLPAVLAPPQPPQQLLLRHASQSSLDESSQKFGSKVSKILYYSNLINFCQGNRA